MKNCKKCKAKDSLIIEIKKDCSVYNTYWRVEENCLECEYTYRSGSLKNYDIISHTINETIENADINWDNNKRKNTNEK